MNTSDLPDFSRDVLSIHLMGTKGSMKIIHARWEWQGGRLFLIGHWAEGSVDNDEIAKSVLAVAWDRVTDYIVYESYESYQRGLHAAERAGKAYQ